MKHNENKLRKVSDKLGKLQDGLKVEKEKEQKLNKEIRLLESDFEKYEKKKYNAFEELEEAKREGEKMGLSERKLNDIMKNCSKKISEFGILSHAVLENYQTINHRGELAKKLKMVHLKLKKYEDVNKKALDQHIKFSEEIKSLKNRKEGKV